MTPCVSLYLARYRKFNGRSRPHGYAFNRLRFRTRAAAPDAPQVKQEGASTDLSLISTRLLKLAKPYWVDNPDANAARIALAGVVVLSLMTTGVSVTFNFLGRDFFNALSNKDEATFYTQLLKYLGGFAVGIPVFVFRDYFMSLLALRWRAWMTEDMVGQYMANGTFYNVASGQVIDNPDQRLTSDINNFTSSALAIAFTFLTSLVDLVSFSGILFSIYPPLFAALAVYAVGGTAASFFIGKKLVGLNFKQEAREADLRYGLVRVRENAESIAFYQGASSEVGLLVGRLGRVVDNYRGLLAASRNLDFFQSAYRYIIILLPAAVVAPLFFRGEIEFGVVNQSQSAFSHILGDVSLIVYQFETLASFSAVVDRLGEFQEAVEARGKFAPDDAEDGFKQATVLPPGCEIAFAESLAAGPLVALDAVTLTTPNYANLLIEGLTLDVVPGSRLLVMGASGCGKTSLLRAIGGLWTCGSGTITKPPVAKAAGAGPAEGMMFVPQRPYMVLGSLRQQLLYPVFSSSIIDEALQSFLAADGNGGGGKGNLLDPASDPLILQEEARGHNGNGSGGGEEPAVPSDDALRDVMQQVGLGGLLTRCSKSNQGKALDMRADWSGMLSLGEQQRLAFARILLANPALVLLDESTSALDVANEKRLYGLMQSRGITYISVGHRTSLKPFHDRLLVLEGSGETSEGSTWTIEDLGAAPASTLG